MQPNDLTRLRHMVEVCEQLLEFVERRSRPEFDDDQLFAFAVVRGLEVLGEAAARVTEETRALASEIPWRQIVATRNRLIHGYFDVDPEIVWRTATVEVGELLPKLNALLGQLAD